MAHSPLPWRCSPPEKGYFPTLYIPYQLGPEWTNPNGEDITIVHSQNADADAAFIVRACNSHDALVKALEFAKHNAVDNSETMHTMIDDALKLARGEA